MHPAVKEKTYKHGKGNLLNHVRDDIALNLLQQRLGIVQGIATSCQDKHATRPQADSSCDPLAQVVHSHVVFKRKLHFGTIQTTDRQLSAGSKGHQTRQGTGGAPSVLPKTTREASPETLVRGRPWGLAP